MSQNDDYDPPDSEKCWYEHTIRGDRGWLVKRNGKSMVRLDRGHEVLIPWRKLDWKPIREFRPLRPFDLGKIAYNADFELKTMLGERDGLKTPWHGLMPEEKVRWMTGEGPGINAHHIRKAMFIAIIESLKKWAE